MNFFRRKSSFSKEFQEMLQAMALDDEGRQRLLNLSEEQKSILLANHKKLGGPASSLGRKISSSSPIPVDIELFLDLLSKQKLSPPEMKRHLDFTDYEKQEFVRKHSEKSLLNVSTNNLAINTTQSPSTTPKLTKSYKFNQNLSLKSTKRHLKQLLLDLKKGELKSYSDYDALEICLQKSKLKSSFYADNVNEFEIKILVFEILKSSGPEQVCSHSILKELIEALSYPIIESQYEILDSHDIRKDYLKSFIYLFQLLSTFCFQLPQVSLDILSHFHSLKHIQKEQIPFQYFVDLFKDPFGFYITQNNSANYDFVQEYSLIWELRTFFVKFVNGFVSCSEDVEMRSKARRVVEQAGVRSAIRLLMRVDQAPQEFLYQVGLYDEDRRADLGVDLDNNPIRGGVNSYPAEQDSTIITDVNNPVINSNVEIVGNASITTRKSLELHSLAPQSSTKSAKSPSIDQRRASADNLQTPQLWNEIQRLQKLVETLQDQIAVGEYAAKSYRTSLSKDSLTQSTSAPPLPPRKPQEKEPSSETLRRNSGEGIIDASMVMKSDKKLKPLQWDLLTKNQVKSSIWNHIFTAVYQNSDEYITIADQQLFEKMFAREEVHVKVLPIPSEKVSLLSHRNAQNIEIFMNANRLTPSLLKEGLLLVDDKIMNHDILLRLKSLLPSPEILHKLSVYDGPLDSLGKAELMLSTLISIPAYESRLDALIFRHHFTQGYAEMIPDFTIIRSAIKEILSSQVFKRILGLVLITGNYINGESFRGSQMGFKLCSLGYLKDMVLDGYSLLNIVARKIDVGAFLDEIGSVDQARSISYKSLIDGAEELSSKFDHVKQQIDMGELQTDLANDNIQQVFQLFMDKADGRIEVLIKACSKLKNEMHEFLVSFGETGNDEPENLFGIINEFAKQLVQADIENSAFDAANPVSIEGEEEEEEKGLFATMIEQNARRLKAVDGQKPFADRGMTIKRPLKFYNVPELVEPNIIEQVIAKDGTFAKARKTIKQLKTIDQ